MIIQQEIFAALDHSFVPKGAGACFSDGGFSGGGGGEGLSISGSYPGMNDYSGTPDTGMPDYIGELDWGYVGSTSHLDMNYVDLGGGEVGLNLGGIGVQPAPPTPPEPWQTEAKCNSLSPPCHATRGCLDHSGIFSEIRLATVSASSERASRPYLE